MTRRCWIRITWHALFFTWLGNCAMAWWMGVQPQDGGGIITGRAFYAHSLALGLMTAVALKWGNGLRHKRFIKPGPRVAGESQVDAGRWEWAVFLTAIIVFLLTGWYAWWITAEIYSNTSVVRLAAGRSVLWGSSAYIFWTLAKWASEHARRTPRTQAVEVYACAGATGFLGGTLLTVAWWVCIAPYRIFVYLVGS